jgi:hypothetical protein
VDPHPPAAGELEFRRQPITDRRYGRAYSDRMATRKARIADVHTLAEAMPHVTIVEGSQGLPVYQVGGRSFVFFRNPRPDAVDPETGERYPDVIVFWVGSEADKLALLSDPDSPFFTTPHFDGHPSVLLRGSRVGELTRAELAEVVQDAWLARASGRRASTWLKANGYSEG